MEVKRWYEHNHLNDEKATLAFIREWVKVLDWGMGHIGADYHEDPHGGLVKLPFPYQGATVEYFQSINDGQDWKAFARLRALCDRHMLAYRDFCSTAIRVLLGMDKVRLHICEVVTTINLASVMEQVREDRAHGRIEMAQDAYYKAPNYRGTELQDTYYDYVVLSVKKKYKHAAPEILGRLVKNGVLAEQYLKKNVDQK